MKRINPKPSMKVKKAKPTLKAEQVVPAKRRKKLTLPSGESELYYKQFISRERSLRNKERDAHEMTKNKLALANLRASEYQSNFLALNVILADLTAVSIRNPSELQTRANKLEVVLKKLLKR